MDLKYGWGSGAISGIFHPHSEIGKIINAATTHSVDIGGHNVMLGSNMTVDANGNLDIIDAAGRIHHDVIPNLSNHVTFDPNGTMHMDQFAIDHLGKAGIASTLSQDVVPGVDHTTVLRTHAEALTHGVRITDAAGVAHSPSWELPDGTHFVATDYTHYNLVRDIAGGRHETLL